MNTQSLITKINQSPKSKEIKQIIQRLQQLRILGKTDAEIEEVIKKMDLPLGLHLFITGNYSSLMTIKFN